MTSTVGVIWSVRPDSYSVKSVGGEMRIEQDEDHGFEAGDLVVTGESGAEPCPPEFVQREPESKLGRVAAG